MKSTIDAKKARGAFEQFEKTQRKYANCGAADTEPDYVMQAHIHSVIHSASVEGSEPRLPRGGSAWELYTRSMNCEPAARALTAALRRLAAKVKATWGTGDASVRAEIMKHLWRTR